MPLSPFKSALNFSIPPTLTNKVLPLCVISGVNPSSPFRFALNFSTPSILMLSTFPFCVISGVLPSSPKARTPVDLLLINHSLSMISGVAPSAPFESPKMVSSSVHLLFAIVGMICFVVSDVFPFESIFDITILLPFNLIEALVPSMPCALTFDNTSPIFHCFV